MNPIIAVFAFLTVEPILFMDSLAYGISDTATRVLIYNKVCSQEFHHFRESCERRNLTTYEESLIQRSASKWEFYRTLTFALPAVILVPVFSSLADEWSKKWVLFMCPLGSIASLVVYLLTSIFYESPVVVVLVGDFAGGLTGGVLTLMGVCFGYLTAIAVPGSSDDRMVRIAIAEAFQLASRTLSYFVSGPIFRATGYAFVYIFGISINGILIVYITCRIRDIRFDRGSNRGVDGTCTKERFDLTIDSNRNSITAESDSPNNTVHNWDVDKHLSHCGTTNDNRQVGTVQSMNGMMRNQGTSSSELVHQGTSCSELTHQETSSSELGHQETSSSELGHQETTSPGIVPKEVLHLRVAWICVHLKRHYVDYARTVLKRRDGKNRMNVIVTLVVITAESMCVYVIGESGF